MPETQIENQPVSSAPRATVTRPAVPCPADKTSVGRGTAVGGAALDAVSERALESESGTSADSVTAWSKIPEPSSMCCPTCRAKQAWSDTCRRCGSDFTLLRRFAARARWYREQCLLAIHTSDDKTAADYARALYDLTPDASAAKLLAVCLVQIGDFDGARLLAESLTK
jgi:hypothetical protein